MALPQLRTQQGTRLDNHPYFGCTTLAFSHASVLTKIADLHTHAHDRASSELQLARYATEVSAGIIARMACVDGLTVLGPSLAPTNLGVFVKRPPEGPTDEHHFARHDAAMYAARTWGAVSIAVSQDGDITVFDARGGKESIKRIEILL